MKGKFLFLILTASLAVSAAAAERLERRGVSLDIARQMETLEFLKDYIDFIADCGYNSLRLYFEGRLKTPTTHALPDAESYSPEFMAEVRRKARERGVEIIPSAEVLGHAEHFFRDGRFKHLSEERDGDGRWDTRGRCSTFCPTLPESKAFIARYLEEVAAIFPESRLIEVGMDETWHMGFCKLCRERRKTEGFGGIFARHVDFVHGVLKKLGREMYLADDFYEFFPERLAECPKGTWMSHWIYDRYVSRWGHRGHFAQRVRIDLLRKYRELGLNALPSCSMWYDYHNIRALTEYALSAGCKGMTMSHWEMQDRGHGQYAAVVAAAGAYWKNPDAYVAKDFGREGLGKVFPKLTEAEKDVIVPTMHMRLFVPQKSVTDTLNLDPRPDRLVAIEAAVAAFRRSAYAPGEKIAPRALSPEALADDYVCQLRLAAIRERMRMIGPELSSPNRAPGRVAAARKELAAVRAELTELAARRDRQHDLWRKGCYPREMAKHVNESIAVADELMALPVESADDEWWLEVALSMPEYHMHPYWKILVKIDGEWRRIEGGYWKAEMWDWANFERIMPVRIKGRPSHLRVEYHGRGPCSMNYISLENSSVRLGPKSIVRVEGLVRNPENLLVDNWKPAAFGWPDTMETFHRPEIQDLVSAVEFELKELK